MSSTRRFYLFFRVLVFPSSNIKPGMHAHPRSALCSIILSSSHDCQHLWKKKMKKKSFIWYSVNACTEGHYFLTIEKRMPLSLYFQGFCVLVMFWKFVLATSETFALRLLCLRFFLRSNITVLVDWPCSYLVLLVSLFAYFFLSSSTSSPPSSSCSSCLLCNVRTPERVLIFGNDWL